jgi:hypothetical protein
MFENESVKNICALFLNVHMGNLTAGKKSEDRR